LFRFLGWRFDAEAATQRIQYSEHLAHLSRRLTRLQLNHESHANVGCARQLILAEPGCLASFTDCFSKFLWGHGYIPDREDGIIWSSVSIEILPIRNILYKISVSLVKLPDREGGYFPPLRLQLERNLPLRACQRLVEVVEEVVNVFDAD
jgi:hypothetical protein